MNSAVIFIKELHTLGIKVSMDDFGSGYSSLELLNNLPFDEIKFDKAFLMNNKDNCNQTILIHIMNLVKSLNKTIVCEGVETLENINLLEQCDCDIIQGYYYFRPIPLEEFQPTWIK
jgi:EAL domain-containing protein (putative c-di-GMP-specific phosphodiesterase class I)